MQSSSQNANSSGMAPAMFAGLFLVIAVMKGSMVWLAPVFLLSGAALYRQAMPRPAKATLLAICVAMAIGTFGLEVGKDLAVRDNAIQAHAHQSGK
jgi:hypothetical protein